MIKASPFKLDDLFWDASPLDLDVRLDSLHSKISKSSLHVLKQLTAVLTCAWPLAQAAFRAEPLSCFMGSV